MTTVLLTQILHRSLGVIDCSCAMKVGRGDRRESAVKSAGKICIGGEKGEDMRLVEKAGTSPKC